MTRTALRSSAVSLAAAAALALPAAASAASLSVTAPHHPAVDKVFKVTVKGTGSQQDALDVYLDHRSCAKHGYAEDARTGTAQIIQDFGFNGAFTRRAKVSPKNTRLVYVCAYLTTPSGEKRAQTTYRGR